VKGELSWAAIRQARGVPPALDVRSGAGSVRLVDAESRCVLMTWPVAQWCPAWWPAHPRAWSVVPARSGRACGVNSSVPG